MVGHSSQENVGKNSMIMLKTLQEKFAGKSIQVFGPDGMLGSAMVRLAQKLGMKIHLQGIDTGDCLAEYSVFGNILVAGADYIVNAVGYNGGVGFQKPFDIFHVNTVVPLNIINAMIRAQSEATLLMPIASCGYDEPNPAINNCDMGGRLLESGYLCGAPHYSIQPHGYAKRNTYLACQYALQQYGVKSLLVCPPTLFGPGDRYAENRAKFVAANIARFVDAVQEGLTEVVCWGTGEAIREVMYVEDAAYRMMECLAFADPNAQLINIGADQVYSVRQLVELIAEMTGYKGSILWNGKDGGQNVKVTSKARSEALLGYCKETNIRKALTIAIEEYKRGTGR